MPIRVKRVVEAEWSRLALVYRFHDVTQLGREPARSHELQIRRSATHEIERAATADHVHVQLRHDRVSRNGGIVREVSRSQEARLFSRGTEEEERPARPHAGPGERLR